MFPVYLERKLIERQDAPDNRPLAGRLEKRSGAQEEAEQHRPGRGRPSNEIIAVGVAWTAIALTAFSELKGTPGAATVTAYAAEGVGVVAAQLAWYRKRKEENSSDRSRG